jgi:hypothetical protein
MTPLARNGEDVGGRRTSLIPAWLRDKKGGQSRLFLVVEFFGLLIKGAKKTQAVPQTIR